MAQPPRSAVRHRADGFTLLEVVVAVVIAGLALVALFRAGSDGLFAADSAKRTEQAIERAQSHLAALGRAGAIATGETEGDDGGGYRWQLRVRPIDVQPSTLQGRRGPTRALFDVEVTITWRAWGRKKSLALSSRRFGIATDSP
jgi:general secretion pathway protein I